MQTRENRLQVTMPNHLQADLQSWCIRLRWYNCARAVNLRAKKNPHTSFGIACLVAYAGSLSPEERDRIMLEGARLNFEREREKDVPGRERWRLYQSSRTRPAGIDARAA